MPPIGFFYRVIRFTGEFVFAVSDFLNELEEDLDYEIYNCAKKYPS